MNNHVARISFVLKALDGKYDKKNFALRASEVWGVKSMKAENEKINYEKRINLWILVDFLDENLVRQSKRRGYENIKSISAFNASYGIQLSVHGYANNNNNNRFLNLLRSSARHECEYFDSDLFIEESVQFQSQY